MKKRKQILLGATAVLGCLLAFTSVFTSYTGQWESKINDTLGIDNVKVKEPTDSKLDTEYFKSEFGDGKITKANQDLLEEAAKQQCYNEVAEGATLMKNDNKVLPLKSNERKITVFGNNATNFVYLPSGGGEGNSVSADNMMTFDETFKEKGFEINPVLWDAYKNSDVTRHYDGTDATKEDVGEVPLSFYTEDIKSSFSNYNDAAVVVISRESGEGSDMWMNNADNVSKLALTKNERDMINMVTTCGKFDKVIVIINTTNQLELDWLDEYKVDACLWTGSVGQWGATAIPDLLTGVVNPSGALVDTWAADSTSAPACVNSGTNTPKYTNLDTIAQTVKDSEDSYAYMTTQVEGIYVGYRYYETRYEDAVMNQGNATSSKGSMSGSWNYAKEMVYPFGHSLSYTTFEQKIESVDYDKDAKTFTVKVNVKNTGDVAGKKSIQLYAQTPYGEYEKTNGVEKSAIQLVQFGKTDTIEPGHDQTVTLTVDKYLLASYDENKAKTYIISEGDYYFAVGSDVHDALNNILKAKNVTGLTDEKGNAVTGNSTLTYTWNEKFDATTYSVTSYTGADVTNRFDECDLNYFFDKPVVKYLSRSDWDETYPTSQTTVAATSEMIRLLKGDLYTKPSDSPSLATMDIGTNKNISLIQLKDKDYDDPLWDDYLSQYSVEELSYITTESSGTKAIEKYLVPNLKFIDGPMGLCGKMISNVKCTTYASMPILAATYNKDLITRRGELMGEEGLYSGTNVVNGPGLNLHRTPFNGRSCIYFSEDANMTYLVAEAENKGLMEKGVSTAVKHFVLNDQEFHRQGVSVFFEEQGMREIGMRAFESSLNSTDNTLGSMMSFNRLGCVSDNNASYAKQLTRDEWGFRGFFQTDAAQHYSIYYVTEFASGTSLFSTDATSRGAKAISKYISENDDGYLYLKLKENAHQFHYMILNNHAINGISQETEIYTTTPWWRIAEFVLIGVLAAVTAAGAVLIVLDECGILPNRKKEAPAAKEA